MDLDARGMKCPMPIINLSAALRPLPVGSEIRILADDRGFPPDLRAWCAKTGHQLVSLDESNPMLLVGTVRKMK